MGQLDKEKTIIGLGKRPRTIRRQHCGNCGTVLALEVTDKIGFGGEYWWIKQGLWIKERWFGNAFKCPTCGQEGKLPMDKPLSIDQMVKNAEQQKIKEEASLNVNEAG